MSKYETVIGLEVHVQLSTKSKIFCGCSTEFGAEPNSHVCPVCSGMPGSLPVFNEKVAEYAVKAGLALNCDVQERSVFDRKNYFYPDLPKDYQISQFPLPICLGGWIDIVKENGEEKRLNITRIHIEEDAGKSVHGESLGHKDHSYINLNRTGTPLLEIVSEPEMRSGEEARLYLQKLKATLEYLGISDCNMEEGSLRCDANVSIRPYGQEEFGTRAEIKNMNSFKNVEKAIIYEAIRQEELIESGGKVDQETRLWDADKNMTFSMRGKEYAHDYRYFPDPDLVPLVLEKEYIENIKSELPELPEPRKERFISEYGLPEYDAGVLTSVKAYADFFEAVVKAGAEPKLASNWTMGELLSAVNEQECGIFDTKMTPEYLGEIIKLIMSDKISGKIAKDLFKEVLETGDEPAKIVEAKGMVQVSDSGELEGMLQEIIDASPNEAERFKNGDKKLQGFFVGQMMKKTKGKANPKLVNELLNKLLK